MEDRTVTILRALLQGPSAPTLGVIHLSLATAVGVAAGRAANNNLALAVAAALLAVTMLCTALLSRWSALLACFAGTATAALVGGFIGGGVGYLLGVRDAGTLLAAGAVPAAVGLGAAVRAYFRLLDVVPDLLWPERPRSRAAVA